MVRMRRKDTAFISGISEFEEKTGTHDYSKCVVEEQSCHKYEALLMRNLSWVFKEKG